MKKLCLLLLWGQPIAAFPLQAIGPVSQRSKLLFPGLVSRESTSTRLHAAGLLNFFAKPPPPPAPSTAAALNAKIQQIAKQSSMVGNARVIFSKLTITPAKAKILLTGVAQAIHWEELLFFSFMGWLFVPIFAVPHNFVRDRLFPKARPFKRSYTKLVLDHLAQASRIAFLAYIVDIFKILLLAMGFKFPQLARSQDIVIKSLFTWWFVNRIATLKRYILSMKTRNVADDLTGSALLVDRLISAFLYGTGAFLFLTSLETEMGTVTKGFATLGGLSTVVISLASQGFVTQVFYGLFLATSQKFRTGDVVKFGDGKYSGKVASLGWMDSLIRGPDGIMVSVSNTDLAGQSVSNLSRVQISSVKQELRFKYSDANKLPKVLQDIKEEIRLACPELIDDGSRPFRSYWTGYGTMGLEVTVEAHFRIRLTTVAFWENRQNMLIAIHGAVKKNKMELVHVDEELLKAIYKNAK